MKNYINNKLDEFNREHCVESKLNNYEGYFKKQWKKDREEISRSLWGEVRSVSDVINYVNLYVDSVEREVNLNVKYLDIYDIDLALYRAVYAMNKMAYCYDNPNCNFITVEKNEIDALFSMLKTAHIEMKNELARRSMLD